MKRKSILHWAKKLNPFSKLALWLKQRLGWLGIPVIVPYRGYGNSQRLFISGTVLENSGLAVPESEDSLWENMLATIKRFLSVTIPDVQVKAIFMDVEQTVITDKYGFFCFEFNLTDLKIPDLQWQPVQFELLDLVTSKQHLTTATGTVLIIKENTHRFGVISDIDDTVLVSHATNFFKKLRLMLIKNALTRLPFEGVAEFYNALHQGYEKNNHNPVFFVSSSQWNLYDLLSDFMRHHKIPEGPFLLQRFKPFKLKNIFKKAETGLQKHFHKMHKIRHLLHTFESLNFILIGDSGQKDADIYKTISMEFPGRILAIYIRDVRKSKIKKVNIIGKHLNTLGVEMLLIKDTAFAAKHAAAKGFINKSLVKEVEKEIELGSEADLTSTKSKNNP